MTTVEIIADSISPLGHRLTSFSCEYPRFILAEVNTHCCLSRNSPSSRAIPVAKMIERIQTDPAMPYTWPKNQPGMQAVEDLSEAEAEEAKEFWLCARDEALDCAEAMSNNCNLHKQVANRILEPWMMTKSLISGTEWINFFHLRCHHEAQPDFQHLAHLMLKAYLNNQPKQVAFGDWHLPYSDKLMIPGLTLEQRIKICVARAARVSYYGQDQVIDPEKDYQLYDRLFASGHFSPCEHAAIAIEREDAGGKFKGWKQWRHFQPNEQRSGDLHELLANYEKSIKE